MSSEGYISSSELSDFVDHVEAVAERFPQMNEDNTKSKIIRYFLEKLGWEIAFDAELEYSVSMGSTNTFIDYSLSTDGSSPVLLVEAKGYDTSLTKGHREQLDSYLRQTDVNWGLLTNGKRYEIYKRENVSEGVTIRTVAKIELSELPNRADTVSLLSKKALESGRSDELAERIFEIRQSRDTLRQNKDELADEITNTLISTAGEVISQDAETEAKELIDRLIETLDNQTKEIEGRAGVVPATRDSEENSPYESESQSSAEDFWARVEQEVGIMKEGELVKLREETTAVRDYVEFVQFLFEKGYMSREDLPIESGQVRYILNTEKEHKDGSVMRNPKEIIEGVYLETHQNTDDKRRRITMLGERYGVNSSS